MLKSTLTFIIASIALIIFLPASATPGIRHKSRTINRRNGYTGWYWSINSPSPATGSTPIYDTRRLGTTFAWYEVSKSDAGQELNTAGDQIGFRLTKDDSSAVIYHFSSNNIMASSTFTWDSDQDTGPSVDMYGSISTYYPNTTATPLNTHIWNSTDLTQLTMTKTVSVQNVECNGSMNLMITTVDANGEKLVYKGMDSVGANVPSALPANVTVTNDNNTASVVLSYNGVEPVSAAFGSAKLAVPQLSLEAVVQYCPD